VDEGEKHENAPRVGALWAQLVEDYRRHEGDWGAAGFRALAIYRFGVWSHRQKPPVKRVLRIPWTFLYRFSRNTYGIDLHHEARIGRRVRFATHGPIVVMPGSTVGEDCVIRHGVTIGGVLRGGAAEAPVLGRRVELGVGATIVGRVHVGDDARIGPNTAITRDVPEGAVVVAPAPRTIYTRTEGAAAPSSDAEPGGT
jgi:serine O-acetyltransferase